ncbi:MAG: DUF222 domain-containing protein [Acidimicrobiaceae bacterium]|nr:DUF222 domain-containing protein [Acidimicrobiaceae bacterium]MCY4280468.1 DUF222 domain-containing protein [Acidimicrobiaceae bacterium]MCY4295044.1 DUF222 domain-containing protein [Acidimicrobiaceae bacterium]
MILEAAQRARTAAADLLAAVNTGTASTGELRKMLDATRAVTAAVNAAQTAAAELIARRERHGDGGVEILAASAGLSQREARSQVATAAELQKVPELRDAVQSGGVPAANARKLADAITRTCPEAVAGDADLLAQAQTMRPEHFTRTAQRWIGAQQADAGAAEYLRQRARRYLRIYDTDDGMVALHGEFDKVTGTRLRNRLSHTANKLLNADKKLPEAQRRKFPQCMADALQHYTAHTSTDSESASRSSTGADRVRRSGNAADNGNPVSGITGCGAIATPDSTGCGCSQHSHNTAAAVRGSSEDASGADATSTSGITGSGASGGSGGEWVADITVLAHVDDATGELIAELSDGSRLPAAALDALSCNARWTGLVFDRAGDAIWRSRSRRTVTDTQWQALFATYGGCFHCGAPAGMCQAHHITPYSEGGATSLDNLIMVCWNCHHRIHHHNWQIHEHSDGSHSLHPPDDPVTQPRYGPAHADDPPSQPSRTPTRAPTARTARRRRDQARARARDPALW